MVTQDVEDSLENDLTWRMYTDILVTCVGFLYTSLIGLLAFLCILQHYTSPPIRLLFPGNETYRRIAWLKLVSGSAQLLLYFGFKADLIYPCCNMLSVHFNTFLPAIDGRIFFVLLAFVAFLNRFSQAAFMIKRLEASTSGLWFPSLIQLTAYHLFTIFLGYYLYNHGSDQFTDAVDYCAYMSVDLCNKYSVEEDHNHFHIDFRFVSLLRFLNYVHIFATIVVMAGCLLRVYLAKYDIHICGLKYPRNSAFEEPKDTLLTTYLLAVVSDGDIDLQCILNAFRAFKERKETLLTNSLLAIFACMFNSFSSSEVLFGNFPFARSSSSSFDHMMNLVINGEYIRLMNSENYYSIWHIGDIIDNLRSGRKWNEDILHPSEIISNRDYY